MSSAVVAQWELAGLVARNWLRESLRQRVVALVAGGAVLGAAGVWMLRELNFGASELKFLLDAGLGAEALFGSVLAIVVPAQQFAGALERRTADLVLARPVRRGTYVAGHLGGALALLAGYCALVTLLLAALLWWRETGLLRTQPEALGGGHRVPYAALAGAGFGQWLRLGVVAAATLLVASYARSAVFASLAGFGGLIAGQLQHVACGHFLALASPWARVGGWLLRGMVPDLHRFGLADRVSGGEALPVSLLAGLGVYAALWVAGLGCLAAWCFHRRDL